MQSTIYKIITTVFWENNYNEHKSTIVKTEIRIQIEIRINNKRRILKFRQISQIVFYRREFTLSVSVYKCPDDILTLAAAIN